MSNPIPHNCWLDEEEALFPSPCVFDDRRQEINNCSFAAMLQDHHKDKTDCKHYRATLEAAPAPVVGDALPPRPSLEQNAIDSPLVRYGVTWDGSPDTPLLTPMPDGCWTPWHIAAEMLRGTTPAPVVGDGCARIELVTAIHCLASHFEIACSYLSGDDLQKAKADIAHAISIAAKHNQNGTGCTPAPVVGAPFVVRHYVGSAHPEIKGNGFDGLVVGENREEAEEFVAWINARLGTTAAPVVCDDLPVVHLTAPERIWVDRNPYYIDPDVLGTDSTLLEVFYSACQSEGGTADEVTLRGLRAVLAKYGPTPVWVAVSERPWEREGWCDDDGRCWWGRRADDFCNHDWHYATRAEVEEFCADAMPQVSLPFHALPLPEVAP